MSDFFQKLASSSLEHQSSDHLKLLGKRAAGLYSDGAAGSLNDAVSQALHGEDLNREQVARITETANQETWKAMFVEHGDREVHFEPASADIVIGGMSAKPVEVEDRLDNLDYSGDVPNQAPPAVDLAEAFGVSKDTPEYEALNPTAGEQQVVEKTAAAADYSRYSIDVAANRLAEAGETFYRLVKHAYLDEDCGVLQISKAASVAIEDPTFAKDVMQKVAARLEAEGVKFDERAEMRKMAHALVVNSEHPLVQAAANLERAAFAFYQSGEQHEKLSSAHRKAIKGLRDKMRAR